MRILLLTENPVLALGLEAALSKPAIACCSAPTVAELRGQMVTASGALVAGSPRDRWNNGQRRKTVLRRDADRNQITDAN